eukprot:gene1908-3689_t
MRVSQKNNLVVLLVVPLVFYILYSQLLIRRIKRLSHQIKIDEIIQRVQDKNESLYEIAIAIGFSPYKLAKMYTEKVFENFQLSQFIDNPQIITNIKLRTDIIKCCTEDISSSTEVDLLKHCVGTEYEEILYTHLNQKQICYETENEMRRKGKPKTPDASLLIPMGIYSDIDNQFPEHWIFPTGEKADGQPLSFDSIFSDKNGEDSNEQQLESSF